MSSPTLEPLLFIARDFTLGGAAYLALEHMRRLLARYEIHFLVTGPCDEEMLRQLPKEVCVLRPDLAFLDVDAGPRGRLDLILAFHEIPGLRHSYSAILATSVFTCRRACMAVSLVPSPRKLVFLVDEMLAYPHITAPEQRAIEECLLAATLVVPVSRRLWQRMADQRPSLRQRPWEVLHPPVDHEKILRESRAPGPDWGPRDKPVVLTVARLVTGKQILECLQVHHQLRQAGLDFRWYIIGIGPEEAMLRAEIAQLGMGDAFLLVGRQENVYTWMAQCDVFALFSSSEGCPTVVIEALLLRRAVIMTEVNGADDLIDHGRTGLIVPNTVADMAAGLSKIVQDSALRELFRRHLAGDPPITDTARETKWLVEKIEEPPPAPASPRVSILIPTYNHEWCIHHAIASALMQDFPALEVIVADDASTDQTEALARTWAGHPQFRYMRNERNLGRVANYRKAVTEYARGEWALMLDGDDYLIDPEFIRKAWEALQRHADQSVVFAQAGHQEHFIRTERPDWDIVPKFKGEERLMKGAKYLTFVFETGFFTHLGILFNRQAAMAHDCYTLDISSSDMDTFLRLALEGKVLVLRTIAGRWVRHDWNTSSHVPLGKISANVRIFRRAARMAMRRRLTSRQKIDDILTRYEAQTLSHLFGQTLGKTLKGPLDVLRMLAIVIFINPRLFLKRFETPSWNPWKLARLVLRRWASSLPIAGRFIERKGGPA